MNKKLVLSLANELDLTKSVDRWAKDRFYCPKAVMKIIRDHPDKFPTQYPRIQRIAEARKAKWQERERKKHEARDGLSKYQTPTSYGDKRCMLIDYCPAPALRLARMRWVSSK